MPLLCVVPYARKVGHIANMKSVFALCSIQQNRRNNVMLLLHIYIDNICLALYRYLRLLDDVQYLFLVAYCVQVGCFKAT